ncbi:MAG TPA: efflux RND transporter periplasmic adaptor subunit [Bryobacteraceae bacterium]|nr:efflux RND transporter periplasmic adaptor subunit [Bryobacteraceae bacterium]
MRVSFRVGLPALVAAIGLSQWGCGNSKQASVAAPDEAKPPEPALFSAPPEQLAHMQVEAVHSRTWTSVIETTGTVDWDADHTTQAITQVNGPISRILVDLGTPVKAGDPLLYVASPDVANAISAYRKARNREVLAKRIVDRMQNLLDHGSVAIKDVEGAQADYNDAMTDVQNSLQTLRVFGIDQSGIDDAEKQGTAISTELPVRAPIAGVIVQKLVSPGQLIQAGSTVCFMLSDVSKVWVQGHVFDPDLTQLHVGVEVDETNPASGKVFHGRLDYVGAFVDPATRTTPVRIVTDNPEGLLKKDMFVEAAIHAGETRSLGVPVSAVLRDDKNEPMVYVQAQPGKFAQRSVTIGRQQDGMIAILSGLRDGDNVLADGSIFLQFANSIQ